MGPKINDSLRHVDRDIPPLKYFLPYSWMAWWKAQNLVVECSLWPWHSSNVEQMEHGVLHYTLPDDHMLPSSYNEMRASCLSLEQQMVMTFASSCMELDLI